MKLNPDRLLRPLVISLLVVTAIWLAATLIGRRLSSTAPQVNVSSLEVPPECPAALSQYLLARDVSATVQFMPQGTLRVTAPYQHPPRTPPDQGAQVIWTVFDAAAALPAGCTFHRLEVTIEGQDLRAQASVTEEMLRDWAAGHVDDAVFIDQVAYAEATPEPGSTSTP